MNQQDLELVMAYHDGQLEPNQQARVALLLEREPEARAWLKQLRDGDEFLRNGLAGILDQPASVPNMEAKALSDSSQPATAQRNSRVLHFPARIARKRPAYAVAASVLCLMAAGFWLNHSLQEQAQTVAPFMALTLDSTPSGHAVTAPEGDLTVMPLATYATTDGEFCRTYAGQTSEGRVSGLACRRSGGQWVEVVEQVIAAGDERHDANGFRPATGHLDEVTPELDRLGTGEPIAHEQEALLLQNNWD